MKVAVISAARSDEGIYMPLLSAMKKEPDISIWPVVFPYLDWVVVLGDTWPMLEATIDAVQYNIPVAHIHGGDRSGSVDESIRHAITRFAHLHFPAIEEHAERLRKMGEEGWRIKVVGPLGIYAMLDAAFIPKEQICEQLRINGSNPIVLVLQHPVSTQIKEAGQQMGETLEAIKSLDVESVVFLPNGDLGSADMVTKIASSGLRVIKNLPYLTFLSLLKVSACIVGNSSCGLVEAPLFGVPCVNVGNRQGKRERGLCLNPGYHSYEIRLDLETMLKHKICDPPINPYLGYKDGPQIIIDTIKNTPVGERLLQKRLTY